MDFEEHIVLVTGGGAGIGLSVAEVFATSRAPVAVLDINLAAAQQTVGRIEARASKASRRRQGE